MNNDGDIDPGLAHAIDVAVIEAFAGLRRLRFLIDGDERAGAYAERRIDEWERTAAG